MTLWTNKQSEQALRDDFKLDIPQSNGNIYYKGIQVGYADSFSGIRLSKKVIDPDSLDSVLNVAVWNPHEETNFEIDMYDEFEARKEVREVMINALADLDAESQEKDIPRWDRVNHILNFLTCARYEIVKK